MKWARIEGYENYLISDTGIIKNINRNKVLKQTTDKDGYHTVTLFKNNHRKILKVHRLVLAAFTEDKGNLQVNHKNGIKSDNFLENLEWCTAKDNIQHAFRTGLHNKRRTKQVIRNDGKIYNSIKEAAKDIDGDRNIICMICKGTYDVKRHKGYSFKYLNEKC